MKNAMLKLMLIPFVMLITQFVKAESVDFDKAKIGGVPDGWEAGVTGKGHPKWAVEADATAPSKSNVLKQSGEGTYPFCVKKDVALKDGFVEVKFKPLA